MLQSAERENTALKGPLASAGVFRRETQKGREKEREREMDAVNQKSAVIESCS